MLQNQQQSAANPNACTFCYCLGYSIQAVRLGYVTEINLTAKAWEKAVQKLGKLKSCTFQASPSSTLSTKIRNSHAEDIGKKPCGQLCSHPPPFFAGQDVQFESTWQDLAAVVFPLQWLTEIRFFACPCRLQSRLITGSQT